MKKNYSKFLLAIGMMLMAGVSFTSCDEVLDVIDKPVTTPTGPESEAVIEETAQGAKVTINSLSATSDFIDELKDEIVTFQAKHPGQQFVLDIVATEPLETTDADNVLLIPELSVFDIVINVNSNITTNGEPLILKLNQKATTRGESDEAIKTSFDNKITLNLKNDDIDLILDVPGTTVIVNKLNSIQILNGVSIVKDGGSIKTYIWAPTRNNYDMNNGEPEWVPVNETSEDYIPNVRYEDDTAYRFKNLKIVKGKADYARVNVWEEKFKLDKLTIADGATVNLNSSSFINEIEGEGSAKLILSGSWWTNTEDNVTTYYTQSDLYNVSKISNIAIENYFDEGTEYDKSFSFIYSMPSDIENVTFKADEVHFAAPNSASAAVKNCKFEGTATNQRVTVYIPGQTEAINAFKFNFEKCEFNENIVFGTNIITSKIKLDKDGKPVLEDRYEWVVFNDDDWYWADTNNEADIPEAVKAVGLLDNYDWEWNEEKQRWEPQKGYWKSQTTVSEDITFKNFYATVAFTECKYAGETLTAKTFRLYNAWMPQGAYLRFEFDGKTYRALWDTENQTYVMIEA